MNLSVLIPTVPPRHESLNNLLNHMSQQSPQKTEIVIFTDKFEHTVGEKRNRLLHTAKGEFVVFIDDDDWIHPRYFDIIDKVIKYKDVDYISYRMSRHFDGVKQKDEYRSIKYNQCFKDQYGSYRHISHTNPIKREIASLFKFPEKNQGEDNEWCQQIFLSQLVKEEFFVNLPMYEQRLNTLNSSSKGTVKKNTSTELRIPSNLVVNYVPII